MKKYEMMIVFDQEAPFEEAKKFVYDLFKAKEINVVDDKDYGVRDLAYEIDRKKRGHYFLVNLEAQPKILVDLNKEFKMYNGILRFLTVKKDK